MNPRATGERIKRTIPALRVAAYLLAVLLVCIAFTRLCAVDPIDADPTVGLVDLTAVDFARDTVAIDCRSFYIYPGAFYLPEDFAAGAAPAGTLSYGTGTPIGEHGTARVELRLPPGLYAISAKNASYAQRLFIDGVEAPPIGAVGDSPDTVSPKTTRYVQEFAATGETTEIVLHYAAYVYADGGGLYSPELGSVANIARHQQLRAIRVMAVTAGLIVAAIFLLGLFLHFPGSRYLLWFGLCCVCIALRGLCVGDKIIMVLLPELSWYLSIRLEFLSTFGIALFSGLYLYSLFPVVRRWIVAAYAVFCTGLLPFVGAAPTVLFSRYLTPLTTLCGVYLLCQLVWVFVCAARKKLRSPLVGSERSLLLIGLALYVAMLLVEIVAHPAGRTLGGMDFDQVGMVAFLFLHLLALVLGFAHAQRERDEARLAEREIRETNEMLERLDRLKTNFLQNITHELNTPLTVIGARAGRIRRQLRLGALPESGEQELEVIEDEAVRLSGLVRQLLHVSLELNRQLTLTDTDAAALLRRAADFCAPLCKGRRNRITVRSEPAHIPLRVSEDSIFRVLLNLITNANRQAGGSVIALAAQYAGEPDDAVGTGGEGQGSMVAFTVTDQGGGIAPELLDSVFQRGVSGGGGKGLGLAICREIVERHGGGITVENTGEGARVRFTLPCGKGEPGHER